MSGKIRQTQLNVYCVAQPETGHAPRDFKPTVACLHPGGINPNAAKTTTAGLTGAHAPPEGGTVQVPCAPVGGWQKCRVPGQQTC